VKLLSAASGSREISAIVDHDLRRIAPGVVIFENRLGGRIATLPHAIQAIEADISHLICYHRRRQLKAVFDWMRPDAFPVWLVDPPDVGVHLWEDENRLTVCLSNLSFDAAGYLALEVTDPGLSPDRAVWVGPDGVVQPLGERVAVSRCGARTEWRIELPLASFDPVVLLIGREHGRDPAHAKGDV
jgi:hypothetical protein